jgi:hypothetical protein
LKRLAHRFKNWQSVQALFHQWDPVLVRTFVELVQPPEARYEWLFSYFLTGFLAYQGPSPSLVFYPGARSFWGARTDAMEGVTRMLPLLSAWLAAGRPKVIVTLTGKPADLQEMVAQALIAGTDSESPGYWGDIAPRRQQMVEAADVALALWLSRRYVWDRLDGRQRNRIVDWLLQINSGEIYDNNWHLFPVLVNLAAAALGASHDSKVAERHYLRFKSFYRGDGWFSDGPGGVFDYYNAWGIHYSLFWIDQMAPDFDRSFIREALQDFLRNYVYFLSPQGFPILGRSVCYRLAAASPLIAGHLQDPDLVGGGLARRALEAIFRYFVPRGAVAQGAVTQGYCGPDLRFLENYSGQGSCLWSLRSLILAFFCPEGSPFWTAPAEPLPIEKGNFRHVIPSTGWTVTGNQQTQEIVIDTGGPLRMPPPVEDYTLFRRFLSLFFKRTFRPDNYSQKYELSHYSSKKPFCGCIF